MSTAKTSEKNQASVDDLDPDVTVPVSVRLPAKVVCLLYLYAERMNTSMGKLLTSILEDTLPTFEKDSRDFKVTVRIPQVYRAMENAHLLSAVKIEELRERILKRTEPGGPMGRPPKGPRGLRRTEEK
jgi:hypothetical protein